MKYYNQLPIPRVPLPNRSRRPCNQPIDTFLFDRPWLYQTISHHQFLDGNIPYGISSGDDLAHAGFRPDIQNR